MSVKIMGLVWDCDLPRNEKYILLALADHADHDGCNIYPSVGRVAWKTGYDERMVQRIIKELTGKGILIPDGQGKRGTNRYRIEVNCLPNRQDYNPRQNVTPTDSGGGKMSPNGVQNVTPTPGKMSPEPSYNHPTESSVVGPLTQKLLLLCRVNYKTLTRKQKQNLAETVDILQGIGCTEDALESFTRFWSDNWRGKNGPPALLQVPETWGEFEAWQDTQPKTRNGRTIHKIT